jgi:probable phosphoglycerate mutase
VTLFFIRHGATEWSVTGQHTGRTDLPLSGEGLDQLGSLSHGLRQLLGPDFGRLDVVSSPMSRALVSATTVMGEGHDIRIDPNLAEFDYGDYEGLTTDEIREQRPGWDIWRDGCPNGESVEDVGRRADAFLASIEDGPELVAIFAHAHLIRIMAARATGLDAHWGEIFTLDTATLSVIDEVRGKRAVKLWNVSPKHL